jgi:hypothetical protein
MSNQPVCPGNCKWILTNQVWVKQSGSCSSGCECKKPNSISLLGNGTVFYTYCEPISQPVNNPCSGSCSYVVDKHADGSFYWLNTGTNCVASPDAFCECTSPNIVPGSGNAVFGTHITTQCSPALLV